MRSRRVRTYGLRLEVTYCTSYVPAEPLRGDSPRQPTSARSSSLDLRVPYWHQQRPARWRPLRAPCARPAAVSGWGGWLGGVGWSRGGDGRMVFRYFTKILGKCDYFVRTMRGVVPSRFTMSGLAPCSISLRAPSASLLRTAVWSPTYAAGTRMQWSRR